MKKSIILICLAIAYYHGECQNPPLVEKAAPTSNPLLPSNGTLGSNSGVNPAGNPGTIISYSGNSNSINNKTTPNPNIEPGVFLNSSPEGTVVTNTVINGTNVQQSSTATVNGATVTAVTETEPKPVVNEVVHAAPPPNPNPPTITNSALPPSAPVANPGMTTNTGAPKSIPAYSPVLGNYIPQEVIKKIKNKYGNTVYDIKAVKVLKTNRVAYLVRLSENGNFRNELFYDEP